MSRRWFQFRLKTLLILLTLIGVALGLFLRSQRLRQTAHLHAVHQLLCELTAERPFRNMNSIEVQPPPPSPEEQREIEQWRELAAYHGRLKDKYDRAAWLPFLPVADDPPRPPAPLP